jgi:uncharacterized protein (TIGR02996 family)
MTTEDDFQNWLDEHPDDHHTRLVFADWLQERGDPRAEGYRALGRLRRWPHRWIYRSVEVPRSVFRLSPSQAVVSWLFHDGSGTHGFYQDDNRPGTIDDCHALPADWFRAADRRHLVTSEHYVCGDVIGEQDAIWTTTRRSLEDRVVAAFAFVAMSADDYARAWTRPPTTPPTP